MAESRHVHRKWAAATGRAAAILVVLTFASSGSSAWADEASPAASVAAEPTEPTASDEATTFQPRAGRTSQHALGLGYHMLFLRTEATDNYLIHGPSLVYDYFHGRRWGFFLRASAYLALFGTMSGPSGDFNGSLTSVYDTHHYGVDGLFGVGRRLMLSRRFIATFGAGVHIQWFSLAGTAYSPVEDVSMGVGGLGKLDYTFNHWMSLSAQVATAIDPFDLADHHNPARLVVPLSMSVAFDARY